MLSPKQGQQSPSTASSTGTSSGPRQSAASEGASTKRAASSNGSAPPVEPPPLTASYEELMALRAGALKRMLQERGVGCADCFDKEALARRLMEGRSR